MFTQIIIFNSFQHFFSKELQHIGLIFLFRLEYYFFLYFIINVSTNFLALKQTEKNFFRAHIRNAEIF